jgi:hypothetical protein
MALSQAVPEINAEVLERGQALWREMIPQYLSGPLPFVKCDPEKPDEITSCWNVVSTGNEIDDVVVGFIYASLVLHRAKTARGNFDPLAMIIAVVRDIVKGGQFGGLEYGFFSRLGLLSLAASLN